MANLQISLLTHDKLESLKSLLHDYPFKRYSQYPELEPERITDYSLHSISTLLANERNLLLVALENTQVVGFVSLEELSVDSEHFNRKMARIGYLIGDSKVEITRLLLNELLKTCSERQVQHLVCRINTCDVLTAHLLEAFGFRIMTTFIGFAQDLTRPAPPAAYDNSIRPYREEELAELKEIARTAFSHTSRFHVDPTLPTVQSNEFHARWIENSCHGLAAQVFVVEAQGRVQGFVTCEIDKESKRYLGKALGVIGLIAVSPVLKDHGLGTKLIHRSLDWFRDRVDIVEVGTESTNDAALNLYMKNGFKIKTSSWTFHKVF